MTYKTQSEKMQIRRAKKRTLAITKLGGDNPECAICGCPHAEILHIGHMKHRDGRFHRREAGGARNIVRWILKTPIEEIRDRVQLECPYCNNWHNKFKEYPPFDKQPVWPPRWGKYLHHDIS